MSGYIEDNHLLEDPNLEHAQEMEPMQAHPLKPSAEEQDPFHDIPHLGQDDTSVEFFEGAADAHLGHGDVDLLEAGAFPDEYDHEDGGDDASLLGRQPLGEESAAGAEPGVFSLEYYRWYWDITTRDVLHRLRRALFPMCSYPFLRDEEKPDLYAPFWITTTLVFMMVITANIAERMNEGPEYVYDFRKMTVAAPVFYSYISIVPIVFWYLATKSNQLQLTLSTAVCLYGYSLAIYVPTSVLCIVPSSSAQWMLVSASCGMSSYFLLTNFWRRTEALVEREGRFSINAIVFWVQVALQLALALIFKLYFFKYKEV